MNELDTFKAELRAAGQPWSRRGVWALGAGMVLLAVAQVAGQIFMHAPSFFAVLVAALVLLGTGWIFFVIAFVKRRRWAKDHPIEMIDLPGAL